MLNLKAVGDICPGDKLILGQGICSMCRKYGTRFPLSRIRQIFSDSDLVIGNLEGILSQRVKIGRIPELTFCGCPEFASELRESGFNVINVANNHVLEHGPELFLETISHLEEAGLRICGLRDETRECYSKPVILGSEKGNIAIMAYNWIAKDKFADADKYIAQSHDSVVNYTWQRNKRKDEEFRARVDSMNKNVINDIRKLSSIAELVVLVAHWGHEFVHDPPYGVIKEAHSFIDAGADLIIGIHPHVLQGFEVYKGKWIFYSLGNFVFDMKTDACKNSAVLEYKLKNDMSADARLIPVRLNNKFQPEIATGKNREGIERIIEISNGKIKSSDNERQLCDDAIYRKFEKAYNRRKLLTIVQHFQAIFYNPLVIKVIAQKVRNFAEVVMMRLKGEKVRW